MTLNITDLLLWGSLWTVCIVMICRAMWYYPRYNDGWNAGTAKANQDIARRIIQAKQEGVKAGTEAERTRHGAFLAEMEQRTANAEQFQNDLEKHFNQKPE